MEKEKYYRSPIDKLVVESGLRATKIAEKMGIKYHRIVALRRLKDVSEEDIKLCEQAILAIDPDCFKPKIIKKAKKPSVYKNKASTHGVIRVKKTSSMYEYLLGQAMVWVDILKHKALKDNNQQVVSMIEKLEKDVRVIFR